MNRAILEANESVRLAPYACLATQSRGRQYQEPPSETRTCFQRDRDRIIHSKAFRRLKQKTQVFLATESDHYRSRLTHTLEVSQISRHVGRLLQLNEDLCESIALAHDLGHTPFGHSGERILNTLMASDGGFEHNQQSRRIVDYLESRYPTFPGLNLSHEVREGLLKHRAPSAPRPHTPRWVTLEAQVCNLADEIAYNTHDIDDGVRGGLIQESSVLEQVPLWQQAHDTILNRYPHVSHTQRMSLTVSELIAMQITDVLTESALQLAPYQGCTLSELQEAPHPFIRFSDEMAHKNQQLRQYLYQALYAHPTIYRMNKKGQRIIQRLFEVYHDDPRLLPPMEPLLHDDRSLSRKIADYIAGMTDSFAIKEYDTLCL